MPFALVIIGLMMIITGAKDTHEELGKQLTEDFTGDKNFTMWVAAIGGIGAVGYIKALQPISRAFMVLILLAMTLSNKGFFAQFNAALAGGPETIKRPIPGTSPGADSGEPSTGNPVADYVRDRVKEAAGKLNDSLPNPWDWVGNPFGLGARTGSSQSNAQQNFSTFTDKIVPTIAHIFGF